MAYICTQEKHQLTPNIMADSIFFENYKIKSSDVDKNAKVKLSELVNYMQESAWNNATNLGFSTYDMLKNNVTWVLQQQFFQLNRTPVHGEIIRVETWPVGVDRFFVYRNFRIFDESDNLILKSFSKWVVIDIQARKMIAVPKNIADSKIRFDRGNEEFTFERIRIDQSKESNNFPITVGWNDLDVNGHINNAQYFRWVVDAMGEEILSKRSIKSISIIFKSEGKIGEQLSSQCWRVNADETHHQIINTKEEKALIVAKVLFNKN